MSIADLRIEYDVGGLNEADLDPDPFVQFQRWFDTALTAKVPEPNAMTLATASAEGRPSARIVLLKGFDAGGFVFYTNYESRKGQELNTNPWAALVFYWHALHRQVRIEGRVAQVPPAESDLYFASRPPGSRIGSAASAQSRVLPNRAMLEQQVRALETAYPGGELPRPAHWGGYRLAPDAIEFWQGRPSRLHDRLRYRLDTGIWVIERLSP